MKKLVVFMFLFSCFVGYPQREKTYYFLINKKDTLIGGPKIFGTSSDEGYVIIDEKLIKKLNRTPTVEGKIWIPESDDDHYYPSIMFSVIESRDTIVSASYLDTINIIKERRQFLDLENFYDPLNDFIFIEPVDGKQFILRKVYIVYH